MPSLPRLLAALIVALLGLVAAMITGAGLIGALAAVAGGVTAFALLKSPAKAPVPEEEPAPAPALPLLPTAADVIAGIEDPVLIVRSRRVLLANAAAKAVLGEHIEGVDVRLAIRHPAASELLAGDDGPAETRSELTGIGERERRWEMATALIADGSRLVRLTDRSEAHAAERMRGDFVANASHELRTPLATLLGFLETLQDEAAASDPKTRSRFLGIMFDEATRMHRLVDDLISLSRIEAERFSVPREAVPLLPLVEEVRGACQHVVEERGSEVVVETLGSPPVSVGDRSQLSQLLRNLVVNALKYGRQGTPVRVRFEEAGPDLLRMSVIDQGDGIAPEHLPRLTERFYRVDTGRSRAVGGTGLGLAIVKHIVGRHRGRIEIHSRLGEGTSVEIYLPRATEGAVTNLS